MRVLGLFSGIGGFELGLGRAGMETVAFCENDKKCQAVLKKHWPDVPIYDDVRILTYERLKADGIETIDLICGGFPCQPFSVAGKQTGKKDDRYLWPEMFRIIKEIRPTWVIGENVTGIINLALDQVLADLESEGYSTQTFIIPACGVNAPHRRNRVWIISHSGGNKPRRLSSCRREKISKAWGCRENISNSISIRTQISVKREFTAKQLSGSISKKRGIISNPNKQYDDTRRHGTSKICGERSKEAKIRGSEQDVANATHNLPYRGVEGLSRVSEPTNRNWWEVESSMGRVVARFSSTLDETIKDYGYENDSRKEAYTKINIARREILREVWEEQYQVKQTSSNKKAFSDNDFMHEVSRIRAHEKWKLGIRIKEDEELCGLWKRLCAKPFQETQDLQSRMLERTWEIERNEKVASSRVDRLKQLGNAVVPQVVEIIGRAIMECQ